MSLPESWLSTSLGAIVDYGRAVKAEPAEIGPEEWLLELEDIERDSSRLLQRILAAERNPKSTKNRFEPGDVLYGKLRPYLNKILLADRAGVCSTEVIPIKTPPGIDSRYLFYWMKSPMFLTYVQEVSHGLDMPRLGTDAARSAPVTLAPSNEQKRIADKLDALLARVHACRDRLDRIPEILNRFRQAVLDSHLCGDGSSTNRDWKSVRMDEVCMSVTDGDHQPPPQATQGVPFITISAINKGKLNLDAATRFVPLSYLEGLKTDRRAKPGDILYSVTGSIGIPALVDTTQGFVFQRHIALLKPNPSYILSRFLLHRLNAPDLRDQAISLATGTAQVTISLTALRSLTFDLPALTDQQAIVDRIDTLLSFAHSLEVSVEQARSNIAILTPSVLAKAFLGELVPQDPNDEPAETLLRRIKESKGDGSKKSTKRVRPEKVSHPPNSEFRLDCFDRLIRIGTLARQRRVEFYVILVDTIRDAPPQETTDFLSMQFDPEIPLANTLGCLEIEFSIKLSNIDLESPSQSHLVRAANFIRFCEKMEARLEQGAQPQNEVPAINMGLGFGSIQTTISSWNKADSQFELVIMRDSFLSWLYSLSKPQRSTFLLHEDLLEELLASSFLDVKWVELLLGYAPRSPAGFTEIEKISIREKLGKSRESYESLSEKFHDFFNNRRPKANIMKQKDIVTADDLISALKNAGGSLSITSLSQSFSADSDRVDKFYELLRDLHVQGLVDVPHGREKSVVTLKKDATA